MYAAGLKVFQKLEEGGGTNVPECKNTSVGNSVRFVTVGGGGKRGTSVRLSAFACQPKPGDFVEEASERCVKFPLVTGSRCAPKK